MKAASLRLVLLVGAIYCVIGLVLGPIAGQATSAEMRVAWRWVAWAVSAIAFAGQIWYDLVRLRCSTRASALHASLAAALGAFGLAVAANIHARSVEPSQHRPLLLLSLAIWPIMMMVVSFIVAFIAATILDRVRLRSAQPDA